MSSQQEKGDHASERAQQRCGGSKYWHKDLIAKDVGCWVLESLTRMPPMLGCVTVWGQLWLSPFISIGPRNMSCWGGATASHHRDKTFRIWPEMGQQSGFVAWNLRGDKAEKSCIVSLKITEYLKYTDRKQRETISNAFSATGNHAARGTRENY